MRWDVVCARACDGSCVGTRFECGFGFARAAGEGRAHLTDVLVLLCVLRFCVCVQWFVCAYELCARVWVCHERAAGGERAYLSRRPRSQVSPPPRSNTQ